jgi:hypothetical protein
MHAHAFIARRVHLNGETVPTVATVTVARVAAILL